MTSPEAKGQIVSWYVFQCPNNCVEPKLGIRVEERFPFFNEMDASKEPVLTTSPPLCSVCGTILVHVDTVPPSNLSRKF